jgi:hypothetical protein
VTGGEVGGGAVVGGGGADVGGGLTGVTGGVVVGVGTSVGCGRAGAGLGIVGVGVGKTGMRAISGSVALSGDLVAASAARSAWASSPILGLTLG